MKRIAIVIGSPLHAGSKGHLKGVSHDISNYRNYFESSVGGGYIEGKNLFVLQNPTSNEVLKIRSVASDADLLTLAYSGHGVIRSNEYLLQINDRELIRFLDLQTTAKRQINFIDACRTIDPWEYFDGGLSGVGLDFHRNDIEKARIVYDHLVRQCPEGRASIFSCSKGQSSIDNSLKGGLFTVSLLETIASWTNKNNALYSLEDSFIEARKNLRQYVHPEDQLPQLVRNNIQLVKSFPIAINPDKFVKVSKEKSTTIKPVKNNNWVAPVLVSVGVGALIWALASGDE